MIRNSIVAAVTVLVVGLSLPSWSRADCSYTVGDKVLSGDVFYGPDRWDWCNQSWINSQVSGFGIDGDSWKGHGGRDGCNTSKPTGRFFTGLVALEETAPMKFWPNTTKTGGNILQWGAGWAWQVIDETKVHCGRGTVALCKNCSVWDPVEWATDFEIICYVPPYFYGQNVEERASTLMHEARHWDGKTHNRGNRDSSFGYNGAWAYEVSWLSWYAGVATPAPKGLRCDAQALANKYISDEFKTKPDFVIDVADLNDC